MNKFDILTEKLIKTGKSHNLLRIPMFIVIMAVVIAEGVYEIGRKVSRFLFKRKFLSKALSFAVAWLMFAPFYQPAIIFAMEEASISEPAQNETSDETETEETTASSEETSEPSEETTPSSDTDTTSSVSDNTDIPEEEPSETEETSVTPSETELPEETETPPMMMATEPDLNTVEIGDFSQLKTFLGNSANATKNVKLTADINCGGAIITPMSSYSGTFDGQGHVIKNVIFGTKQYKSNSNTSVYLFSGMFVNFSGTMKNVGFDSVTATSTGPYGRAAVVAYSGGTVSNCYIVNSTTTGKSGEQGSFIYQGGTINNSYANYNGIKPSVNLESLDNYAKQNDLKRWYKDTSPINSNYGYPSMKPTVSVEFYKSAGVKFTGNSLAFTVEGNKATADSYAVVLENENANKILLPDTKPEPTGRNFAGWTLSADDIDYEDEEQRSKLIVGYDDPLPSSYTVQSSDVVTDENGNKVVRVYAVWNFTPTYTLEFLNKDLNEDSLELTGEINTGKTYKDYKKSETPEIDESTIVLPANTLSRGYKSDGWFIKDTNDPWELGTSVSKSDYIQKFPESVDPWNIQLEEQFSLETYTITFVTDGENSIAPMTYNIDSPYVELPTDVTKRGYIFSGWKVTESTDEQNIPIDTVFTTENNKLNPDSPTEEDTILANITVEAQWTPITYTVEYNINATTYIADDNAITPSNHTYDAASPLSPNTFKRNYYEFAGWSTTEDGGAVYPDNANVENLTDTPNGTVTLYAVWTPKTYDITYVHTDIENSRTPEYSPVVNTENPVTYSITDYEKELVDPTCAGYTFIGWEYDGEDIDGNVITLLENDVLPTGNNGSGVVITGKWKPTEYTVEYKVNGKGAEWIGGYNPPKPTYKITTGLTLLDNNRISRAYYDFAGWKISGEGCNENGTVIPFIENTPMEIEKGTYGDITLNAIWTPYMYTMTFSVGENNSLGVDSIEVTEEGQATNKTITSIGNGMYRTDYCYSTVMTLPRTPSKTGYSFDHWTAEVQEGHGNGNFPESSDEAVSIIENNYGNVTLTAYYKINQYTISFETNGGSEVADITEDYGTLVSAPEPPTKEGHTFEGWFSDEECTIPYSFTTIPAQNITVYAKWEILKFDVVFANADVAAKNDVPYGSTIERPENPQKSDDGDTKYRFIGWFSDAGCTEVFDFSLPIKEDTTVYAKWLTYTEDNPLKLHKVLYKTSADSEDTVLIGEFANGEQFIFTTVLPDDDINHKVFKGFVVEGDTSETPTIYTAGDLFTVNGVNDAENEPLPVILVAVWDAEKYTVTFLDDDGVTEIAPNQEIEYNQKATAPSPEKRGFIFKGWFIENSDIEFLFDTPITDDVTLVAKWEEITIPETPSRPGSSGSSGVSYDKTIRVTEVPSGISAPSELFKADADMDDFRSSVDVRITNASESAEDELKRLLKLHTDIPDDDIFIFDISLYERGTDRKITLPEDTMISLTIPICDKFVSNLEKVRVVSVHDGKLVIYPEPEISSSGKHLLVNFSSDKFSTFAFVLDKENQIADLSAAAPSTLAAEMMLVAPPAMMPAISGVIVNEKTKLRISRKKKIYKVLRKFH